MQVLLGYCFTFVTVFIILLISGILNYKLKLPIFYTRKIAHILLALLWPIQYFYFFGTVHLFIPISIIFVFNLIAYRFKLFKGIEFGDSKNYGTICLTAALLIYGLVIYFYPNLVYYSGIGYYCCILGDGLAAIVGYSIKKCNCEIALGKTLLGSTIIYIVSFLVALIFKYLFIYNLTILSCLFVGALSCTIELFCVKGTDNFFLPILIFVFSILLDQFSMLFQIICCMVPLMAFCAIKFKLFTVSACAFSIIYLLCCMFSINEIALYLILIPFVANAIVILLHKKFSQTKLINEASQHNGNYTDKNGRNIYQLICGGVSSLISFIVLKIFAIDVFLYAGIIAVVVTFGDTMASDIGVLSKKTPIDICTFKKVESGASGGVTIVGSIAAVVSIILLTSIIVFCNWHNPFNIKGFIIIISISILGVFTDSILGSSIQAKYKCRVCGQTVESKTHCNSECDLIKGFKVISNSIVNLISTTLSALLGMCLLIIM